MPPYGDSLNLIVCGLLFVTAKVYEFSLARAQRDHKQAGLKYLRDAAHWWSYSWLVWSALYLVRVFEPSIIRTLERMGFDGTAAEGHFLSVVELMLSDLNSLCILYVFYLVSRGPIPEDDEATVQRLFVAIGCGIFALDGAWVFLGSKLLAASRPAVFLRSSSMCLAIGCMFMLGRALKARFGTNSVWVLTLAYSVLQVFAYGANALPDDPAHRQILVHASDAQVASVPQRFASHVVDVASDPPSGGGPQARRRQVLQVVESAAGREVLAPEEVNEILTALAVPLVSWPRLQLCFDSMLFSLLAIMKLLIGMNVFAQMQRVPPPIGADRLPMHEHRWTSLMGPLDGVGGVKEFKIYYWGCAALALLVFVVAVYVHANLVCPIGLGAYLAGVFSVLYGLRGNKTVSDVFKRGGPEGS